MTPSEGSILVGISNPETAHRLVGLSMALADATNEGGDTPVLLVHVVPVANQISLSTGSSSPEVIQARDLLQRSADAALESGRQARAIVEVARNVEEGLLAAAESHEASLILVGYSGGEVRSKEEERFDRTMRRVAGKADADVVVATFRHPDHRSILVPIAENAPLRLTAKVCRALVAYTGGTVTYLHVTTPDVDEGEARARIQARLDSVDRSVEGELEVITSDDAEAAIVAESAEHDLVLLGPSGRPGLLDRIFSSRARRIAESVTASVVIGWRAEDD